MDYHNLDNWKFDDDGNLVDNLHKKATIIPAERKFIKDYHSTSRHLHSEVAKLNSLMARGKVEQDYELAARFGIS